MTPQAVIDAAIAVLLALHEDDENPLPVYAETIPQNFARPCYFIAATQHESPLMKERALRQIELSIHRYPAPEEDARAAGAAAAELLALGFEWLTVEDRPRRATFLQQTIRDDDQTLVLTLRYDFHILKHRDPVKMQKLTHSETLR